MSSDKPALTSTELRNRMFLIIIEYQSPWEHISYFLAGLRKDTSLRWEIPMNPTGFKKLLSNTCAWLDERDRIWRAKYAIKRKTPPKRWKRAALPPGVIDDDTETRPSRLRLARHVRLRGGR